MLAEAIEQKRIIFPASFRVGRIIDAVGQNRLGQVAHRILPDWRVSLGLLKSPKPVATGASTVKIPALQHGGKQLQPP